VDFSKISQKKLLFLVLLVSVSPAVIASNVSSNLSTGSPQDSVNEEDSSNNAQIEKVEKTVAAGNQGSHTFYYVYLENGSKITYDYYKSNHPLCPAQPEKCGEDSKDPGWNEVDQIVNSDSFREKEDSSGKVFRPIESICLQNRSSMVEC